MQKVIKFFAAPQTPRADNGTPLVNERVNLESVSAVAAPLTDLQVMAVKERPLGGARPPVSILDKRFKYVSSANTDIRETFKRLREKP